MAAAEIRADACRSHITPHVPERRIAVLESRVDDLLKWQQSLVTALTAAFASSSAQHDAEKQYVFNQRGSGEAVNESSEEAMNFDKPTARVAESPSANAVSAKSELTTSSKVSESSTRADSVASSQVSVKGSPSTAPTTPGTETPPVIEIEKPVVQTSQVSSTPESASTLLAYKVLDIIQAYGQHLQSDTQASDKAPWAGRAMFAPKVESKIVAGEPIRMILPSFPWKSINRVDKVTGALPDLGEELALARLDNLCRDIAQVYEHGAEITIATDGLAFNDLVGISDEDTWTYSQVLMDMAATKGFHSIKLVRIMDLFGMTDGAPMTKEIYLETVDACRKELESQFGRPTEAIRDMIMSDDDTLLTYRGFIRFLETDLRHSPIVPAGTSNTKFRKIVKQVAEGMMVRAESFTKIIQAKCPNFVRLSIHPSSGAVKLSIPLIPQASGVFPKSPWHSSIAVGIDGSYTTVHSKDVQESHVPVSVNDRPYFYREKSPLYDWAEGRAELEHLYPGGLIVRARQSAEPQVLQQAELEALTNLAALQPSVVVQGFSNLADGKFSAQAVMVSA